LGGGTPAGQIRSVAISPGGNLIAVDFKKDKTSFIYVIRVDTGSATRLTAVKEGVESSPAFSADAKQVAYTYWPGAGAPSRIVIVNVDGSNLRQWSPTGSNDVSPVFSPDNRTLVFSRFGFFGSYSPIAQPHAHEWNFYAADLDGGNVRQITNESFYSASAPSVSADGKNMVVVVEGVETSQHIAVYSLDQPGKPILSLQPHVPNEESRKDPMLAYPNYLPDGSILLMAANKRFDYDVYRLDPDTGAIEKLTNRNGYATDLKVSADGRTAVFLKWRKNWLGDLAGNELYLLDLQSGALTPLNITGLN
jgi:Tol biopolymer transport system component